MSDLSLPDERKVVKKIFTSASLLLYKFFDLNYLFFMSFLTCFVRLMALIVLIFVQKMLSILRSKMYTRSHYVLISQV